MKKLTSFTKNLLIIIIVSIVCIILFSISLNWNQFLRVTSVSLLLSISAFIIGGTLGFLFGLPSYKNKKETKNYERNSSLKDIADWITKIFIGITLVELKSIIENFKVLINNINNYLEVGDSMIIVSSSILISFFLLGFVTIYLLTITDIFKFLANTNSDIAKVIKGKGGEIILSNDVKKSNGFTDYEKSEILTDFIKKSSKIDNIFELKKWGRKLFIIKEYAYSANCYERAYKLDKKDVNIKLNEAYIRSKFLKQTQNSNNIILDIIKNNPNNAIAHYNLACNYNREYANVKNENINESYKNELKDGITNYLGTAFKLDNGLLSEAIKDDAFEGVDVNSIFSKVYSEEKDNS